MADGRPKTKRSVARDIRRKTLQNFSKRGCQRAIVLWESLLRVEHSSIWRPTVTPERSLWQVCPPRRLALFSVAAAELAGTRNRPIDPS